MADAKGLRQVGYADCAGGGQVIVENGLAFIGHTRAPHGTSIWDVKDPRNPRELATIAMPPSAPADSPTRRGKVPARRARRAGVTNQRCGDSTRSAPAG